MFHGSVQVSMKTGYITLTRPMTMIFVYNTNTHLGMIQVDKSPPAPKVLGRDLPDGTPKRLQVYRGGGHFSLKTACFW